MEEGDVLKLVLLALYLLPGIIAALRRHRNANAIGVLNLLLGWTLLGWIAAFVWSLTADVKPREQRS
jgi:hypothetical protein